MAEDLNLAEWLLKKFRQRQEDIETLGARNIKSVEDYRFHIADEKQHFAPWNLK